MVLKVRNLADWTLWEPGKALPLPKDKTRTVRLEVICQTATEFRVWSEDDYIAEEPGQLIAVMPHGGQDIIEFTGDGNILVQATSDGDVMFYTAETEVWWVEFDGEVSFTKPYEHKTVDPAFQAMQLVMYRNMQAMEARLQAGVEARVNAGVSRRLADLPTVTAIKEGKPVVSPQPAEPAAEPPAGETPPAGAKKPAKAPASGGAVQPPAAGEGG
jgi:hypothetical protein